MRKKHLPYVSKNVLLLSTVSFLNDIGGETIKKIIPLYLLNVLGVSPGIIGFVEGIADSTPQVFQPLSGIFSDRFRKRKPFVILGQILRSLVLLLVVSTSWVQILLIRFFDRTGKGIEDAPRDALVTDSSTAKTIGKSFGLNRAFDNAGAVTGFVFTGILLLLIGSRGSIMTQQLFRLLVLIALLPLIIALGIVTFGVKDMPSARKKIGIKLHPLNKKYWKFLVICVVFTLANSSDAFLMLKAQQHGVSLGILFLLLALYSGISALVAYPISSLSDKIGRKGILLGGWIVYGFLYVGFAFANTFSALLLLFIGYGCFLGLTEGVMKAWIADVAEKERRATAFGVYNMAVGLTLLPASLLTGVVWQYSGLSVALFVDAGIALFAALLLLIFA